MSRTSVDSVLTTVGVYLVNDATRTSFTAAISTLSHSMIVEVTYYLTTLYCYLFLGYDLVDDYSTFAG